MKPPVNAAAELFASVSEPGAAAMGLTLQVGETMEQDKVATIGASGRLWARQYRPGLGNLPVALFVRDAE